MEPARRRVERAAVRAEDAVPNQLHLASAIAWRFLVVAAAAWVIAWVLAHLRVVILPFAFALLLASVLSVPAGWLRRRAFPPAAAAAVVLVGSLVLFAGVVAAIAPTASQDFGNVGTGVESGIEEVTDWLAEGPLDLSPTELTRYRERAIDEVRGRADTIAGGVLGGAYLVLEIVAGAVLALFLLFFILKDGDRMWPWAVRLFPPEARADVDQLGRIAWRTMGGYLGGQAIVALVDAVFIGLALWLIGVPLVLPLAILTFLGGFFPVVGAFVAGGAAALIALVSNGFVDALLVVAAATTVQQLEGNLLQPMIVGRAVRIHPVAVILAVTSGAVIWGLPGAILAVPTVAVAAQSASYLRSGRVPGEEDVGPVPAREGVAEGPAADGEREREAAPPR
ncbi:MAG: AI-2E family transporter [Thermoleophilia bacterium]|nr:AI-2E family transporter [Thermoleophilia bacterium]